MKMKTILAAALLALGLVGCGEERVRWNCACAAQCPEGTGASTAQACATQEEAESAVQQGVEACVAAGADRGCTACACTCEPTGDFC